MSIRTLGPPYLSPLEGTSAGTSPTITSPLMGHPRSRHRTKSSRSSRPPKPVKLEVSQVSGFGSNPVIPSWQASARKATKGRSAKRDVALAQRLTDFSSSRFLMMPSFLGRWTQTRHVAGQSSSPLGSYTKKPRETASAGCISVDVPLSLAELASMARSNARRSAQSPSRHACGEIRVRFRRHASPQGSEGRQSRGF